MAQAQKTLAEWRAALDNAESVINKASGERASLALLHSENPLPEYKMMLDAYDKMLPSLEWSRTQIARVIHVLVTTNVISNGMHMGGAM